jgi:hypothetical protein
MKISAKQEIDRETAQQSDTTQVRETRSSRWQAVSNCAPCSQRLIDAEHLRT